MDYSQMAAWNKQVVSSGELDLWLYPVKRRCRVDERKFIRRQLSCLKGAGDNVDVRVVMHFVTRNFGQVFTQLYSCYAETPGRKRLGGLAGARTYLKQVIAGFDACDLYNFIEQVEWIVWTCLIVQERLVVECPPKIHAFPYSTMPAGRKNVMMVTITRMAYSILRSIWK
jgi:hypothetical protein